MNKKFQKQALEYHSKGKPGKVTVISSKECNTEESLSLAYSPGVAAPCNEIFKDPAKAYDYTAKGNLVGVITNGTAVLGLGNIGPLAGKPVMEGKGVLFKQFADIDVFDIELNANSPKDFINVVKALEPTFGGINLEDIKAPECFEIEETLIKELKIPVFHDDQHGTAIISAAALVNSLLITKKKAKSVKVVFNGAGAAAISCAKLFKKLGVLNKNLIMCDSKGVIHSDRNDLNKYKEQFAIKTKHRTLADALKGADVFVGLSVAGALTAEMLKTMAKKPIVFAMANPNPEIDPKLARKTRDDVIIATGRSDYPNQVNNVLGFPFIFRGALDVHATKINEEMKMAALQAIATLAREDVPDSVSAAYSNKQFSFGPDYIIPKPFDPRVLVKVSSAVAKAAMDSGVSQKPIKDFVMYEEQLEQRQGFKRGFIRNTINRVKLTNKTKKGRKPIIVFPEGRSPRILKAIKTIIDEDIVEPIIIGYQDAIDKKLDELEINGLGNTKIIQSTSHPKFEEYVESFYQLRKRRGVMWYEAERLMSDPHYFAAMMVRNGDADGVISGASRNYADCVKPIFQIIESGKTHLASGLNIVLWKGKMLFFADTTVNINPTAEQLATIAIHVSKIASYFKIQPRIAMISYSNFTANHESSKKMNEAARIVKKLYPSLIVDGEMQVDTAINPNISDSVFPFCKIKGGANILIFPNLDAGNSGYKLVQQLGDAEVLGPFLVGLEKPANVLQRTGTVEDVINTCVLTALQCQVSYQHHQKKK